MQLFKKTEKKKVFVKLQFSHLIYVTYSFMYNIYLYMEFGFCGLLFHLCIDPVWSYIIYKLFSYNVEIINKTFVLHSLIYFYLNAILFFF